MTKTISPPLLLAASLACNSASADLLDITGTDPDLAAFSLELLYDAGTDAFTVSHTADTGLLSYTPDGLSAHDVSSASYSLTATVDGSGTLLGGSLSIEGEISGLGIGQGVLLGGSLGDFGYLDGVFDQFQFLVTGLSGALAGSYGTSAFVNISTDVDLFGGFSGKFTSSFAATGMADQLAIAGGTSDLAAVPVPPALWLFGSGLLGVAGVARRRTRG